MSTRSVCVTLNENSEDGHGQGRLHFRTLLEVKLSDVCLDNKAAVNLVVKVMPCCCEQIHSTDQLHC